MKVDSILATRLTLGETAAFIFGMSDGVIHVTVYYAHVLFTKLKLHA